MINEAEKFGINFKPTPENQLPSIEYKQLMDKYNQAKINLESNPNQANQNYFNAINGLIRRNGVKSKAKKVRINFASAKQLSDAKSRAESTK